MTPIQIFTCVLITNYLPINTKQLIIFISNFRKPEPQQTN